MKKLIIKNCPALFINNGLDPNYYCYNQGNSKTCQISNCILKQIVEKCKEAQLPVRQWTDKDSIWEEYSPKSELAKEILDLLDIEECE